MKKGKYNNYNKNLNLKAKVLRKNMTEYEKKLWYRFLNEYEIRFYKQRIIDNFIADFYCPKAKLIIEIDGEHHHSDKESKYDKYRTEILSRYNIEVLRFDNSEIKNDFHIICEKIDKAVKTRLQKLS